MTGLSDEIRSEPSKFGGRRKRIREVLDALDENDQAALLAALDDHTVAAVSIKRALMKRGLVLGESTISHYRNGNYGSF
jgi:hypothetical protein